MAESEKITAYLQVSIENASLPSPEERNALFERLIKELSPREGKPGPMPARFERLKDIFTRLPDEDGFVTLPQIVAAYYPEVAGEKHAASDVSALGKILDRWEGFQGYEIEAVHVTAYRIRLSPDPDDRTS